MACPVCQAENDPAAEHCFSCGHSLAAVITRGQILESRFEILEPIGKGGMGAVYKVHDRVLDETVALKVLRAEFARSPEITQRFRREIKLARRVRHKNVCAIHHYGDEGRVQYISMEYVPGHNLHRLIRARGRLPTGEALALAAQIADGLQAIHDAGVVHRDLKTANIVVDEQGLVRLMDFGIAKQVDSTTSVTTTGAILGTPEYMSPEQANAEPVDLRSDLYALGVIVFELLTGDVPFRANTPLATMMKHVHEPPPLDAPHAAVIPPDVRQFLARALAKSPANRFGSASEMAEILRELELRHPPPKPAFAPEERRGGVPVGPSRSVTPPGAVRREPRGATTPSPVGQVSRPEPASTATRRRVGGWLVTAGVLVFLGALVGTSVILWPPGEPGRQGAGQEGGDGLAPEGADGRAQGATGRSAAGAAASPAPGSGAGLPSRPPSPLLSNGSEGTRAASEAPVTTVPVAESRASTAPPTVRPAASSRAPTPAATLALEASVIPSPAQSPLSAPPRSEPASQPSATPVPVESATANGAQTAARPPDTAPATPAPAASQGVQPGPAAARDRAAAVPAPLATPPPKPGELRVIVVPWAEVVVDGRPRGTTPLPRLTLDPGPHTVEVRHPAFEVLERVVTIRAGALETLHIDLETEGTRKD